MRKIIIVNILFIVVFSSIVYAPPPTPHNVAGKVFNSDGIGVDNGIMVRINDTTNKNYVFTKVDAPPIPFLKGIYSTTIDGSDNDDIVATAWNQSHYNSTKSTLAATTTTVNLYLNKFRPSETNVSFLLIQNNSQYNQSNLTQVSINMIVIGGANGVNCYAILNITDTSVLNLSSDHYIHSLENIDLGSTVTTTWNVTGLGIGNTTLHVSTYCDSDGENFDRVDHDAVYNVTLVEGYGPPIVNLVSPDNDSVYSIVYNDITFMYNVSGELAISNCSLLINNTINQTNLTIKRNTDQYFYETFPAGRYNWSVVCTLNSTNKIKGYSITYFFTISSNTAPDVNNLTVDDPISLLIGSVTKVYCNASVMDFDNISDIKSVNVSLHHLLVDADSEQDNNNHYINNSCEIVGTSEFIQNYSCSFNIYYYADPGIWSCNFTAYDYSDNFGSSRIDTNVDELVAIDVAQTTIDFGGFDPANTSVDDVNLTITNLGNMDINISLKGFGDREGDNLSMVCSKGNISIGYEKYSASYGEPYVNMVKLNSTLQQIANFSLPQRTNDTNYKKDRNNTYWKISIPYGVKGPCNGSVNLVALLS
ncbi:MAG: hypothetical protein ABIC04_04900 [Nanoarchaeota archaeon]